MSASNVFGVVLVGAAAFGVLASVRYLLLAYLLRDRKLAWIAAAALVVFGIVALLMADSGFAAADVARQDYPEWWRAA
jgi:hypothetical protein